MHFSLDVPDPGGRLCISAASRQRAPANHGHPGPHTTRVPRGASHPQNYQVTGFAYSSVASIPKSVEAACSAASLPE